jgi:hypothetical protein
MKTQILVIGRNEEILTTIIRLINKSSKWEGHAAMKDEEAIKLFGMLHFDLVLLSSGISSSEEEVIRQNFNSKNPEIKIVQHYGGGSGLLSSEILQALQTPSN